MTDKILGKLDRGLLFIISAPAGTGKTTLVRLILDEFPCVIESVSCTTRAPREGETPEKDYHFISEDLFEKKIQDGDFLEYARVFGHYYGTSREFVERELASGKHVILVIDTQGAMQVKKRIASTLIFVSPPNFEELRERLFKRKTETLEKIEERLSWAKKEMAMADEYNYQFVNDNLHHAYDILRSILIAEEHKIRRTPL